LAGSGDVIQYGTSPPIVPTARKRTDACEEIF
jgi:hypothetical protein